MSDPTRLHKPASPETPTFPLSPPQAAHFAVLAADVLHVDGQPVALTPPEATHRFLLDAPQGTRRVALRVPPGRPWRSRWCVAVALRRGEHAAPAATLSLPAPDAELTAPQGGAGPLQLEVALLAAPGPAAAATPPPGCEPVLLADAACGRATRQSSQGPLPAEDSIDPARWMHPTAVEPAPWYELDLGQQLYVDALRAWLPAALAGNAGELEARLYTALDPDGAPFRPEAAWSARVPLGPTATFLPRAVGRFLRLTLRTPAPTALDLAGVEVLAARLRAGTLEESTRRAFALFADRPLFADPPFRDWLTYRQVWTRACALAAGLAPRIEAQEPCLRDPASGRARQVLGLWATNQTGWVLADLAALIRAWVSVPLGAADGPERVAAIARAAQLTGLVAGREQAPHLPRLLELCPELRLVVLLPGAEPPPLPSAVEVHTLAALEAAGAGPPPEWAGRRPDELHSVLFTSGSTGTPKGATRSYAAWNALLDAYAVVQPAVHLSFQPLSHFSERVLLPVTIAAGGQIGFSSGGERLFEDLAALRPTAVSTVPRVMDLLHARYQEALLAAPEQEAALLARFRGLLGDRLQAVGVGSAPPSPALMDWLRRCFADCRVTEGYGSTECGTITIDDLIPSNVELRLIDAPELGFLTSDDPPRGEILVKTPHMIGGYLGDEAGTRARFDAEGWFRTGDLGRREPDGRVRVIGRRNEVIKLAQGEFVAPGVIEAALLAHPLIAEAFVHAEPGQAAVVALVRSGGEGPPDLARLRAAVREAARAAELLPFQVPAAVGLLDGPLPTTGSHKLDRAATRARYAAQLAALQAQAGQGARPLLETLREAARAVAGRELDLQADLAGQLGVDSLAGVELLSALESRLERSVPLEAWFGARSLADLARRIEAAAGVGRSPGAEAAEDLPRADLARAPALDLDLLAAAGERPADTGRVLLLSGASGFLGAHLLDELVRQGQPEVRCLVRARDEAEGLARLQARCARAGIEWSAAHAARVRAIAGDLAAPRLGLAPAAWDALATGVDAVLHAAAQVNWLLLYGQLRAANVLGSLALLELCAARRVKPLHLVSTISCAPAAGDERTTLSLEQALAGSPYGLSKWIVEEQARRAATHGLPLVVYRPAMISAHTRTGDLAPDDMVSRALTACAQLGLGLDLDERLDMTPVDFVARAIVALAREGASRGRTWHLTNLRGSLTWRELAAALTACGVPVRPVEYATFRAALQSTPTALAPLAAWFPARGFALRMGPWPCPASEAALARLGIASPAVDTALVATTLRGLRKAGRLPEASRAP